MSALCRRDYPLVSIIIPVYNGANYLAQAIESAISQSYAGKEIIVVNDGSLDEGATARTASQFGDEIRYYEKPNGGISSALNFGISRMEGSLFSWLSHDDVYASNKLSEQVSCFLDNEQDCIVCSDFNVIDSERRLLGRHRLPGKLGSAMRSFLISSNALHGCTLLIPRTYIDDAGGFDERLVTTQDYDLWFRLASRHRFVHVAKPLVDVRYHTEQATSKMRSVITAEQEAMYCNFLGQLEDKEVDDYSSHDPIGFYLNLFCRFHAGSLYKARDLVQRRVMQNSKNLDLVRIFWSCYIKAPLLRCKVILRNFIFADTASSAQRLVAKLARYLMAVKQ